MEARLKAILEMESSQMQKELLAASNQLKKFERELARSTDTNRIGELQRSIGLLNADITRLTAAANGAAKATAAVGAANKAASAQSMNFARVIQDLPFGFMGIQNNLTQLIPGIGAAGLAFSALTAAITFSQVGLSYWSRGADKAKASVSELNEFTKEFTKTAAEESVKARLLYEASNNVAISMDKRIRAAKELKDMYPDILKNYSAEDVALGKAANGYALLTTEIVKNAKAQAARNRITQLTEQLFNEQYNAEKIKAITDKELKTNAADLRSGWLGGLSGGMAPTQANDQKGEIDILNRRADALDKNKKKQDALNSAIKFYEKLAGGATAIQNSVIPEAEKTKVSKTAKEVSKIERFETPKDKGKWWRNTGTERGNDLSATPDIKVRIEDNAALNRVLIEQSEIQMKLNEQLAGAAEIAEYGGQVFGQMVAAMMNGESIGDVLANAFKQIAVQIAAAVAQALIFAALLEAFPALKGVFASVGAVGSIGQGAGNAIGGAIRGQDIQLSQRRTSTAMGFRRGRR